MQKMQKHTVYSSYNLNTKVNTFNNLLLLQYFLHRLLMPSAGPSHTYLNFWIDKSCSGLIFCSFSENEFFSFVIEFFYGSHPPNTYLQERSFCMGFYLQDTFCKCYLLFQIHSCLGNC